MKIVYDQVFYTQLKKLKVRIRKSFKQRLAVFLKNPTDPVLDNHPLKDEHKGHRSINITADWRVIYYEEITIYEEKEEIVAHFVKIGTHDQLYTKKPTS